MAYSVAGKGNGKTSLALNIAAHAALHEQKRVAFSSLEMGAKQLGSRPLAMHADQDQRLLRLGRIDAWEKLGQATDMLSEGMLWIDETAGLSPSELRSRVRRLHSEQGLDLVIVDYLQLMHATLGEGKRFAIREQEIAEPDLFPRAGISIVRCCTERSYSMEAYGKRCDWCGESYQELWPLTTSYSTAILTKSG